MAYPEKVAFGSQTTGTTVGDPWEPPRSPRNIGSAVGLPRESSIWSEPRSPRNIGSAVPLPPGSSFGGGALTSNNLYNLLLNNKLGGGSQAIYTNASGITMEFLLNIITGEDIKELEELMVDSLLTFSGDDECGERKQNRVPSCGIVGDAANAQHKLSLISFLIEKNLNPINVHAMQRFIPFANIYNYSYSLDRFIYTMYNIPRNWSSLVHSGVSSYRCTKPGQQLLLWKITMFGDDPHWNPGQIVLDDPHGQGTWCCTLSKWISTYNSSSSVLAPSTYK